MAVELPVIDPSSEKQRDPVVALVGNPNAGKTTLFNSLTGLRAKTGNYPGVTVDIRVGTATAGGKSVQLVDLPGLYSLDSLSPEEEITESFLKGEIAAVPEVDVVLLVLDATHLKRNLFLGSEVLDLGKPTVVALTLFDAVARNQVEVDADELANQLGCPVVGVSARTGAGLDTLRAALGEVLSSAEPKKHEAPGCAVGCSGCSFAARHQWAERLAAKTVKGHRVADDHGVSLIDRLATHPIAGVFSFLAVMLLVFYAIFSVASLPMDLIDAGFGKTAELVSSALPENGPATTGWRGGVFFATLAVIVGGMRLGRTKFRARWLVLAVAGAALVASLNVEDFRRLLTEGVIGGIGGVVIFLPQICILFFFISLLEDSGYMARAAFVMERLMRAVGLPGKAFVPMLSAHACAIPGIMATRVIEDRRDRLATILVLPILTCSARLPVYAMVTALLFGDSPGKAALLFTGAYVLGIVAALGTAWVLKLTMLKGDTVPLVIELPPYRRPSLRNAFLAMYDRASLFLRKAGTVILLISVVLWWAANFPNSTGQPVDATSTAAAVDDEVGLAQQRLSNSFAGQLGRAVEPIFDPLGFDWRINIGVMSSFAAREVIVTTLAVVYGVGEEAAEDSAALIPTLRNQKREDGSPVFTPATSISLLVFYVLAMQCLPTQVVTARETGAWKYAVLQLVYMSVLAYVAALAAYRVTLALTT